MRCFRIRQVAGAGLICLAVPFLQAQTVSSSNPALNVTSAVIGVSSTQTARLNVLSLRPVIPGVTAIACPATLEFYDDTGALLKQLTVTDIAPATAANLVFKPPVPSTAVNARAQIRAVVVSPPATVTPVSTGSTATTLVPGCSFLSSFEVVDDTSGNTQSVTTDFRPMPGPVVVPPPVTPAMR